MKVTYKQMIMFFIVVASIFLTVNIFFPQEGPYVLTAVMIVIFVIFKINKYLKSKDEP